MKTAIHNSDIRSLDGVKVEIRANEAGDPEFIEGYAIVFNQRSQDLGGFYEIISPEAVRSADMSDVVALFNHDSNNILGRTGAGTLELTTDERGVKYRIKYDKDDEDHRRVVRKIAKNELRGSSFRFSIEQGGDTWDREENGSYKRTITAFRGIYDVGPVTYPAYMQTTTAQRSLEQHQQAEKDAFLSDIQHTINLRNKKIKVRKHKIK